MGRQVKRVPAGWDWPVGEVWAGYAGWFSPPKCKPCEGRGEAGEVRCKWCGGAGEILPTDHAVVAALKPFWNDEYGGYYSFPKEDPPAGDGWQLWETVSEGSPITPAFATPEELARWCVDHQFDSKARLVGGESWNWLAGGTGTLDYSRWLAFIAGPGWAPSAVMDSKGYRSGVEAMTDEPESK